MTNSNQPRLLVTGSTGALGHLVISELLKRVPARSIVAGVRSVAPSHNHLYRRRAQGIIKSCPRDQKAIETQ